MTLAAYEARIAALETALAVMRHKLDIAEAKLSDIEDVGESIDDHDSRIVLLESLTASINEALNDVNRTIAIFGSQLSRNTAAALEARSGVEILTRDFQRAHTDRHVESEQILTAIARISAGVAQLLGPLGPTLVTPIAAPPRGVIP